MRIATKISRVTLAIASILALAAGSAAALRSLSIRGETGVAAGSSQLVFSEGGGGGVLLSCPVTLLRTISSSFPKTRGILIGAVTGILIGVCRESFGGATSLRPLNVRETIELGGGRFLYTLRNEGSLWRLFFDSFTGTLPRITGVRGWLEAEFLITVLETSCLYRGRAFENLVVAPETGVTREGSSETVTTLPLCSGGILCPSTGRLTGTFTYPSHTITLL